MSDYRRNDDDRGPRNRSRSPARRDADDRGGRDGGSYDVRDRDDGRGGARGGKSTGVACRWNVERGFGFIKPDDGGAPSL